MFQVAESYQAQVAQFPVVTRDFEQTLIREDIEKLILSNLRFVIKLAWSYSKRYRIDVEDLIGAGNLGLVLASKRFDRSRDIRFLTYAKWWIWKEMKILVESEISNRIPSYFDGNVEEMVVDMDHSDLINLILDFEKQFEYLLERTDLSIREKDLLKVRTFATSPLTLEEVGKKWGVTRERVRQVEIGVMKKIC